MAQSNPSLMPGQSGGNAGSAAATNMPTAMPPASAGAGAGNGCGCSGGNKGSAGAAGRASSPPPGAGTAGLAPSLRPASAGAGNVTATWQSNVHVTGLWSINQDRNAWAYLDTVGWRKLAPNSESGLVAMNLLTAHAYQTNAVANLYEADDGTIAQLYVW